MAKTTRHTETSLKLGVVFGGIAALIWGTWPVVTALGVKEDFTPYQMVFLRLSIAAPLLLPWAFRGDNSLHSWAKATFFALLAGGSYSYVTASGFTHTSAMHGGVIIPGTVMLVSLIASHFLLRDTLTRNRIIGAFAIILGLLLLALGAPETGGGNSLFGDSLFLLAGFMWAGYTLMLRIWPMDPIVVTARISLVSLVGMVIAYPFTDGLNFSAVSLDMLLLQAAWQGVFSAVLAIIFFNKGVAILGAARSGVVNACIPVISTLMAFFVLSEVPTRLEQAGLVCILSGIGIVMFLKERQPDMVTRGASA